MIAGFAWRLLRDANFRCLWNFLYGFGWKGYRAVERFKKNSESGDVAAPFLMISVTDKCNLRCSGCWVSSSGEGRNIPLVDLSRVIAEWKSRGVYFFGILGGEPLMYPGLLDVFRSHSDCYFQLFTNGTLLDGVYAESLSKLGNVTPLISVEGLEEESDQRRGGEDVYRRSVEAVRNCREAGLITGMACSVCATNFEEVVSRDFVDRAIAHGAHYLWYYIYRPVGPEPCPQRVLSKEQVRGLRQFLVDIRCKVPLLVIDAYWDHEGNALCPAAVGISHHIGPGGDIELCPPLQFSVGHITDGFDKITTSSQLLQSKEFLKQNSHGCILLDNPSCLAEYIESNSLPDSSGRGTLISELSHMGCCADHDMGEERIPEKHWLYRFAKKHWFFGFGAYG